MSAAKTSVSCTDCTVNTPAHPQLYFADEPKKGRGFESLYELVQHAGNVLPRLYV